MCRPVDLDAADGIHACTGHRMIFLRDFRFHA